MKTTLSERVALEMGNVLSGRRKSSLGSALLFAGPAVIASIAYMDPGNFATNIQAGAKYGYSLLWVVLLANGVAMLFQALSAKLGIVTGQNLAELCRLHFPPVIVILMWVVSEIAAMATDLAEFLGGAIGLSLLLHLPILASMAITGLVTYAILIFERHGFRQLELIIGGLIGLIAGSYIVELMIAPVDWPTSLRGTFVPQLPNAAALTIAVGIIGATVMPHAIFLHSGLTQARVPLQNDAQRRQLIRFSNREVVIALAVAGLVNMAMVIMAASAFHLGHDDVANIETAYHTLTPLLGKAAAGFFLVALIASGISSSTVGTMAGQLIMQGFVGFQIPVWLRRIITMIPAFAVVALGVDSTNALIYSQVILSLALPVPLFALIWLTGRRDIMGPFVNSRKLKIGALAGTVTILLLNAILVLQTAGVTIPGFE